MLATAEPLTDSTISLTDDELFRALPGASPEQTCRIRAQLVARHSALVHWLANRYANPYIDLDDLLQVGYLGLVLAVNRFDPERGTDFVSFARPTVQGEIRRYFRDKRRWIRLPRHLQEAKAVLRDSTETLTHRLGRAPTAAELAADTRLSEELVLSALAADDTFSPLWLDAPLHNDGEERCTVADTIGQIDQRLDLCVEYTSLRPLLENLTERERLVLHMRFFQDKTQEQIGDELGMSQMNVSRVLKRTLTRLRTQLKAAA